jgi:ABC-type polysaccharide/polyol phosphate transport system ATPase subunit
MRPSLLTCTGLHKAFTYAPPRLFQDAVLGRSGSSLTVPIVEDATFSMAHGEWIGLYGPNGTGKTTLLRMIAGLLPPDRGRIERSGRIACLLGLGTGFEGELTAEKNVYLHNLLRGMSPLQSRKSVEAVLEFAGLGEKRHLPVKHYSSGMQLRLGYAAAALLDAELYLFDEIFSVGDAAFQAQCDIHMRQLKARGKAAILVSHTMSTLEQWCDRVLVLEQAKLREHRF